MIGARVCRETCEARGENCESTVRRAKSLGPRAHGHLPYLGREPHGAVHVVHNTLRGTPPLQE